MLHTTCTAKDTVSVISVEQAPWWGGETLVRRGAVDLVTEHNATVMNLEVYS